MKTTIKNLLLLQALAAGLGLLLAGSEAAQTFTTLYSFTNGADGSGPYGGLVLAGGTLYGTTETGGNSNYGTVFSVNTDGTGFTTLHGFTNGSDGSHPHGGVTVSGNTLYGTSWGGGGGSVAIEWTLFSLNTNGTGFTSLYSLPFEDLINGTYYYLSYGDDPYDGLLLSGNTLYGTTWGGGAANAGTVFAANTNGAGFTVLYNSVPSESKRGLLRRLCCGGDQITVKHKACLKMPANRIPRISSAPRLFRLAAPSYSSAFE